MRSGMLLILGATLAVMVTASPSDAAETLTAEPVAAVQAASPDESDAAADSESVADTVAGSAATLGVATAPQATESPSPAELAPAAGARLHPDHPEVLGEMGYDDRGRSGWIHIVVSGDTLWDISDAYLGTPWVWPSIWTDNRSIEDPHLIVPGDRIWITPYEMRRVTALEAEELLAGQPSTAEDLPADALDDAEIEEPEPEVAVEEPSIVRVSTLEHSGLVSAEELEVSTSIVDAVPPRVMLSQGDQVYIGLGADEVSPGDQFTVIRIRSKVYDPDTNRLLGYHVDFLGWIEVDEPAAQSSLASIRVSRSEIELGDRLIPREPLVYDITVGVSPDGVEGKLSFFPDHRVAMGSLDFVYLNRGELDGLEIGSPLEVYRPGWTAHEPARGVEVDVPSHVIAQLLVVRARPETAVALITHTSTELELGDNFRASTE